MSTAKFFNPDVTQSMGIFMSGKMPVAIQSTVKRAVGFETKWMRYLEYAILGLIALFCIFYASIDVLSFVIQINVPRPTLYSAIAMAIVIPPYTRTLLEMRYGKAKRNVMAGAMIASVLIVILCAYLNWGLGVPFGELLPLDDALITFIGLFIFIDEGRRNYLKMGKLW